MMVSSMPGVRASEMPVAAAAAAKDASAAVGRDGGSPAAGQFAAVLQQRAQGQPATAKGSDAQDRTGTGTERRAEVRGQGRKNEVKVGPAEGSTTGLLGCVSPVVVNAALPMAAAADSEAAAGVGFAERAGAARDAGSETTGASGREIEAAETEAAKDISSGEAQVGAAVPDASGAEAKGGAADEPKASAGAGEAAAGSTISVNAASGLLPKPESNPDAEVPEGLLAAMGRTAAGAAPVSGAAAGAERATAAAGVESAKRQGSALKGMQGKVSGAERHLGTGGVTASALGLGQDGLEKAGSGAVVQTELTGGNGRGQHESRPAGKASASMADTAGRDGAAAGELGSGPAQPVTSTAAPVQAVAAAMLPTMAVPVEASRNIAPSDRDVAAGSGNGTGLSSAGAGSAPANAASGAAEAAPLTSVGAARLLKTVAGSELRVGTQSADLGAVTIRTVLGREQMQAHISFENERLRSALSAHLLGGSLEDRLGQSLGVRASVTLSAGTDAGTGQSGREAARDAMAGQTGNGTSSQAGSQTGGGRDGSGRQAAQTAPGGFGGNGSSEAGVSVSRSMPYGGTAAVEGRLDIRI